ncbi:MAG: DUF2934 domain-containing protein [Proteobacteria bacterium]|nr:DUF2934 domain-containing protein [Pseudomonadota bacterium]
MASRRSSDRTRTSADSPGATAAPRRRPVPPKPPSPPALTAEARHELIAVGAYLRAERRGFVHGHAEEDWLAAEAEVDALLKANPASPSQ